MCAILSETVSLCAVSTHVPVSMVVAGSLLHASGFIPHTIESLSGTLGKRASGARAPAWSLPNR
jgi:hypothetical protein